MSRFCSCFSFFTRDFSTGGDCAIEEITGLPDSNCFFDLKDRDNSLVNSSLMSTSFLDEVREKPHEIHYTITRTVQSDKFAAYSLPRSLLSHFKS